MFSSNQSDSTTVCVVVLKLHPQLLIAPYVVFLIFTSVSALVRLETLFAHKGCFSFSQLFLASKPRGTKSRQGANTGIKPGSSRRILLYHRFRRFRSRRCAKGALVSLPLIYIWTISLTNRTEEIKLRSIFHFHFHLYHFFWKVRMTVFLRTVALTSPISLDGNYYNKKLAYLLQGITHTLDATTFSRRCV